MSYKLWHEYQDYNYRLRVALVKENVDGSHSVVQPFVLEKVDPRLVTPSTIDMPTNEAKELLQAIVNGCWDMGIRPSSMKDVAADITATKYHLEDMRKLVFDTRTGGRRNNSNSEGV